jgi:acetyl-CoA acetyltransferase
MPVTSETMPRSFDRVAAIAGVGESGYSRQASGPGDLGLALDASHRALRDAGLAVSDVDGLMPPYMGANAEELIANLGLANVSHVAQVNLGGASPAAAVGQAAVAIAAGAATCVLVPSGWAGYSGRRARGLAGVDASTPYRRAVRDIYGMHGVNAPSQLYALMARRHMEEFGTTSRDLGAVAVSTRQHAMSNANALMREPLTIEQHQSSRWIVEPYRLLDCCLETDGGAAVVVMAADDRRLVTAPVLIAGAASARPSEPLEMFNRPDFFETGLTAAAPAAFAMAGLGPSDMDLAEIYDCFTFEVIQQLEEAGFCARGEGGRFVSSGRIAPGGKLPVNTHGGLLSQGHGLGMNHVIEAVHQLRGRAGAGQVVGARAAFVSGWGDLGDGSALVLERGTSPGSLERGTSS